MPTLHQLDMAKNACYWRLHPRPEVSTSRGARLLYDAVCELWRWVAGWVNSQLPERNQVCERIPGIEVYRSETMIGQHILFNLRVRTILVRAGEGMKASLKAWVRDWLGVKFE